MTKHDRVKMVRRIERLFDDSWCISRDAITEFCKVAESEVSRAVQAERKKWQADEDRRLARLRQIDAELVEKLKNVGNGPH